MAEEKLFPKAVVLEPSFEGKRRDRALAFSWRKVSQKGVTLEELKAKLREVRYRALKRLLDLRDRALERFKGFEDIEVRYFRGAEEVASFIKERMDGLKLLSLNKSNVVVNEIRPHLRRQGLLTYMRYYSEFKNFDPQVFKRQIEDYWMLPGLHERGVLESFEAKLSWDLGEVVSMKPYGALLGVNACAVEEGRVYFLQHMSNISKDLKQAKKLFILVPLEKLVEDGESAFFQAQMVGVYGLESLLLDLEPRPLEAFDFDGLPDEGGKREIYILFYDGGRSSLLGSSYEELLLCIDCRACARQCPVGRHLMYQRDMIYSPKNYLFLSLQGVLSPFEACLHCGRCEVECPVGINLPYLMWRSQLDYYAKKGRGLKKRFLDNPELMAKLGVRFSPITNFLLRNKAIRMVMEWFLGIHREAPMPSFPKGTFRDWLKEKGWKKG